MYLVLINIINVSFLIDAVKLKIVDENCFFFGLDGV